MTAIGTFLVHTPLGPCWEAAQGGRTRTTLGSLAERGLADRVDLGGLLPALRLLQLLPDPSKTLRVTPAMEAGITHHVWELGELLA